MNNEYIISGGAEGKSRLNILSEVLFESTRSLLEAQGLTTGRSFLDVGCGGGNVALMISEIVGNSGSVTAIDFDDKIIALAKKDAIASGITNISYKAMSAYDISFNNEFDFAYSRFLLSHLKNPLEALQKMEQSVKPGGKVIVEDVHFSGHVCYPACDAFNKYVNYFKTAAHNNGQDAEIGPSLYALFHRAGLKNVGFEAILPCFSKGQGKWMAYITLDKIKNTLVEQGIASMETITEMLLELENFTNDETTIMSMPHIFRVWGVKG